MTTTSPAFVGHRQKFLEVLDREHATTRKVLLGYPRTELDFQPHPKSGSARQIAWTIVLGLGLMERALTTGFDWSRPMPPPRTPPDSLGAILVALEEAHRKVVAALKDVPEDALAETIQFPVAPRTIGELTKLDFLWRMLHDQVHHRGQFTVYLRMAEGRVPSIYGPSADEPWT